MKRHPRSTPKGFTLIELVMVILLLAILAAIAIPNFIDFRYDAKNAATNGALGAFRSAIAIAVASIALKEDPTIPSPKYPTLLEMQANQFLVANHPVLGATTNYIMDPSSGIPQNPWSMSTVPVAEKISIYDCGALTKGDILSVAGSDHRGWCYNQGGGIIWANSAKNGSLAVQGTENYY